MTPPTEPALPGEQPYVGRSESREAFSFLFKRTDRLIRIWWVPLACFVPFFGVLAVKGWRLDIVRRRINGQTDLVPDPAEIGRFLADGWWLFVVFLLYHLPLLLIMIISFQSTLESALDLIHWGSDQLFSSGTQGLSFFVVLLQVAIGLVGKLLVPIIYYYLLKPILYAGLLRYAFTGRRRSLVNLPAQVSSVVTNLGGFLKVCLFDTGIGIAINLFSTILLSSVVGAVLIPMISIPTYNAASGYMLGSVGRQLVPRRPELTLK